MRSGNFLKAVAIDGPAGSGKSTISRLVADKLGYVYIDTGAMYRALTLKVMRTGLDLSDADGIISMAKDVDICLEPSSSEGITTIVYLDGENVSSDIRTSEVTNNVKYIAKIPEVRQVLVKLQRDMISKLDGAVMEGRDIGTVVLPDAACKIYLDASFEERVERRYKERMAKGDDIDKTILAEDLKQRDNSDFNRDVGALKMADDAVKVDTSGLAITEVVDIIVKTAAERIEI